MNKGELGKTYSDGEVIFKEGDVGDLMYVIQSGRVRITRKTEAGEVTIATLSEGEVFGEMALFDRQSRSATVIASGNARVLSIDKKKLFSTISRDPTLVFRMLESMSQRIRKLDIELAKLKKDNTDLLHMYVDIDETCSLILEEARNIITADNGSVMLLDDDGRHLAIRAAFGYEAEPKMILAEGAGVAGDVLKTGREELINNVSLDSRFVPGAVSIKSMLCVCLGRRGFNFGVINMSNSSDRLFTLDDLKLLHALAVYGSLALQNAKNFSRLRNSTNEVLRHATPLHG
ncbi:MAG TPA: cyclic nucleotide-binding domain-containing protein [Thermodesulfovibrionales bacterium]|nr:cyclic nucleotide-binding domain-containing protein [Thermodesulfovibrionales bacterium]